MICLYAVFLLPSALLLDLLLGEPRNAWHPICRLGSWARRMERFWKKQLGATYTAGTFATISVLLPALFITTLPVWLASQLPFSGSGWIAAAFILYFCMAPRSLYEHGKLVETAVKSGDLEQSRRAVAMIVGRDTNELDQAGVLRAAIESVGENLTDGVLSTLFWATVGTLIGGAAGGVAAAVLHRCANILDALWGKKNDEYRYFGTCAARTDDALNFLPARLSLPLIAFSALFVRGARSCASLSLGWKYRYAHASPNSAWSEAAFAGALDLKLSGPISYKGVPAPYPYIGEGRINATEQDLNSALKLMWASTFAMTAASALGIALIQYSNFS